MNPAELLLELRRVQMELAGWSEREDVSPQAASEMTARRKAIAALLSKCD